MPANKQIESRESVTEPSTGSRIHTSRTLSPLEPARADRAEEERSNTALCLSTTQPTQRTVWKNLLWNLGVAFASKRQQLIPAVYGTAPSFHLSDQDRSPSLPVSDDPRGGGPSPTMSVTAKCD
jgi:hypothetical protein